MPVEFTTLLSIYIIHAFHGNGINVPGFNTMKEYRIRIKKQDTTLLKCRSTTIFGVSNPSSPPSYRSYMSSTASRAAPWVVKSVAAHQLMNAMRRWPLSIGLTQRNMRKLKIGQTVMMLVRNSDEFKELKETRAAEIVELGIQ